MKQHLPVNLRSTAQRCVRFVTFAMVFMALSFAKAVTTLPNSPSVNVFASASPQAAAALNQISNTDFTLDYDVSVGGSFCGAYLSWAFSSGGSANLTPVMPLSFNIRGDNAGVVGAPYRLKIEFKDTANHLATVNVASVSANFQAATVTAAQITSSNAAFDLSHVLQITYVVEANVTSPASGFLEIQIAGLDFTPEVSGKPYDPSVLSKISGGPVLSAAAGTTDTNQSILSTINFTQYSTNTFGFNWTIGRPIEFVFVSATFPTNALQRFPNPLTIAADLPAGLQLSAEIHDNTGKTAHYKLDGDGVMENYSLPFGIATNLPPGFATNSVSGFVIVADAGAPSGTAVVQIAGSGFSTSGSGINGNPFNPALLTLLPGNPNASTGLGQIDPNLPVNPNTTLTSTQTSSADFNFTYNLGNPNNEFAMAFISFPTAQNLGTSFTVALTIPVGKKLKLEVHDSNDKVAAFFLNGTGQMQNYTISLTAGNIPAGFLTNSIKLIVLVADGTSTGNSGTVVLKTKGLNYTPEIAASAFDPNAVTTFIGQPLYTATKSDPNSSTTLSLNTNGVTKFTYTYNLNPTTDFVFADVALAGAQDFGGGLITALVIPSGKTVKLELHDKNKVVASYLLDGTGSTQNYVIPVDAANIPNGFLPGAVTDIVIVSDNKTTGSSGSVGYLFNYLSTITGDPFNQGNLSTLPGLPVPTGTASRVNGQTGATINVSQTSSSQFTFGWTLQNADDFVFVSVAPTQAPTMDLGSSLVLGLNIANGKQMKLELHDNAVPQHVGVFRLRGTGVVQNYTIPINAGSLPANFVLNSISSIVLVADNQAPGGAAGAALVRTKGLAFTPKLTGAAFDATKISTLPATATVTKAIGRVNGTPTGSITLSATGTTGYQFNYTLGNPDEFVFTPINFDTPKDLGNSVTFGISIPNGKAVKFEVLDSNNKKESYLLQGSGNMLNYSIPIISSGTPAGFLPNSITQLTIVADEPNTGDSQTIMVGIKGTTVVP